MKVRRLEWILLGAILLVGLAARMYRLDASLWYDEIVTLVDFVRLPTRELIATFNSSNNHMFYSLQAQAAIAIFLESAWALRLPAALFGLGSLVVLWMIARRAVGPIQALVTVLLLAISYHHVWFSQNARGYTGLLFWTASATLLFAQGLARPSWRLWSLYGGCAAAAIYTHLSALCFFAAHGAVYLVLLVMDRARVASVADHAELAGVRTAKPIYGFALGAALTLLLNVPILRQIVRTVDAQTSGSQDPASALGEWLSPMRALQEVGVSLSAAGPWVPAILIGAAAAFVAGIASLARRRPVMTAIYLLYFPIVTAILLAMHARIWPRYYFVEIGFIYLAVVHGIFTLSAWATTRFGTDRWRGRLPAVVTAAAVVVMSAGSLWLLAGNYAHPKQDFAGAVAFVERERQKGDAVASFGLARVAFQRYYAPQWAVVDSVPELGALRRSATATWVVIAFPRQTFRAKPALAALLESDFKLVAVLPGTLGDGAIRIYRSR